MKTKLFFLLVFIQLGCSNHLDLASVELGSDAGKYKFANNKALDTVTHHGHYEWKNTDEKREFVRINSNRKTITYYNNEKSKDQFNYSGIQTDSTWSTNIIIYKEKVAEIKTAFVNDNGYIFIEKIIKKLGSPSKIVANSISIKKSLAIVIYDKLHKNFPLYTKLSKSTYELIYPSIVIWNKDEVLYILNFMLDTNGDCRVIYRPMTKSAYKDKVLYAVPLDNSTHFYEYLK